MNRVELPDGGWADLSNPRKVSERKRSRYRRAHFAFSAATAELPRLGDDPNMPDPRFMGDEASDLADMIAAQLVLCLVDKWSFGDVTLEVLEDLPGDAYDALVMACRPLATDLMPDYGADVDPKAHTSASTDLRTR